jgi:N-acetylglucosamine-6-phosphate deacetylase
VTQTLFRGALILDPEAAEPRPGRLLVREGQIEAILGSSEAAPADAEVVDLVGHALAPGFIDIHHHGATAFLPTTVALTQGELRHRVSVLAGAAADLATPADAAAVLGIHLEGPWISADAPGAQPRDAIRPYDAAEGREVFDAGDGLVRMVTLAAEAPGAGDLIAELGRRGIVAALGHTRASAEIAAEGFDRGIRHVTHLFNAMGAFHHREPGAIGAALADERATCDLICDGVHVHPAAVRAAARAKGDRLLLITDAIDPGGRGELGGGLLSGDGPVWRLPNGTLAGSRLGMDEAVRNAAAFGAMTPLEAVAAATLRPAALLGIEAERGTLRRGARADLVLLDESGRVIRTWLGGEPQSFAV